MVAASTTKTGSAVSASTRRMRVPVTVMVSTSGAAAAPWAWARAGRLVALAAATALVRRAQRTARAISLLRVIGLPPPYLERHGRPAGSPVGLPLLDST